MNKFAKLLSLGALLVVAAPFAMADPMNQISFAGFGVYCNAGNTTCGTQGNMTFSDANGPAPGNGINAVAGGGTGIFAPYNGALTTFNNFNYLAINPAGTDLFDAFSMANGSTLHFFITSDSGLIDGNGAFSIAGAGFYTIINLAGTSLTTIPAGSFVLSSQGPAGTTVSFSDTNTLNSVTPEPNSLMLLGTGLVSAAGMLIRRRRNVLA